MFDIYTFAAILTMAPIIGYISLYTVRYLSGVSRAKKIDKEFGRYYHQKSYSQDGDK